MFLDTARSVEMCEEQKLKNKMWIEGKYWLTYPHLVKVLFDGDVADLTVLRPACGQDTESYAEPEHGASVLELWERSRTVRKTPTNASLGRPSNTSKSAYLDHSI